VGCSDWVVLVVFWCLLLPNVDQKQCYDLNLDSWFFVMTSAGKQGKTYIGFLGALSIGIGGMVGGGIFAVLGEAVSLAHLSTSLAFIIAGSVAILTAFAYARLSVAFPGRGGTVLFIDRGFGNNLASGSLNLMLWLSYLVTIALYANAFASYALTFFHDSGSPFLRHLLTSGAILLPTFINLTNASFVSRSETVIVLFKLLLLLVIIGFSLPAVGVVSVLPTDLSQLPSIVTAGMVIFVAYEGFELIANASDDVRNPGKTLPAAFFSSVLIVIMLYVIIGYVTVGAVPEQQLLHAKDYALAVAARPSLGETGFTIVSIAALLATFSAINATIYGNARLGYFLARDGELPEVFDRQLWNEPVTGVLVTAFISLFIANTLDISSISVIASASFLLVFTLVNASAVKLTKEIHGRCWIHVLGAVFCGMSLSVLLVHAALSDFRAILVFVTFIVFSFLFEWVYGKNARGHFLGRPYVKEKS